MKYTYENDENFVVFPTFATALIKTDVAELFESLGELPESFDPFQVLHGTQRTELVHTHLKPRVNYITRGKVIDVQDKGKMSLLIL